MNRLADYRILIVDDYRFRFSHLWTAFGAVGFDRPEVAWSAEDALEKIRLTAYHVVLFDLKMNGMDGVQFIDRLAKLQHNPMLAIVSECPRRIMNSVALMAKEKGLAVLGTFSRPFTTDHAKHLAGQLRQSHLEPSKPQSQPEAGFEFDRETLEHALGLGFLRAWFQPKKSLASGRIVSAEALARWQDPEFGFMLPGSFLSAVRRYGLDKALLLRMLADALNAYTHWRYQGYRVPVSVNLPTQLLDDPDLPDELERIVVSRGVAPQEISFELREDETTTIQGQCYMGASRLRLKGFGLAQHDFGRGYSSMYSLITAPFTELKIDRAFVSGAASDEGRMAALVSAVQLGRQLGLQVTAEGVETSKDLEFLLRIGCDCVQGFLISGAVNVDRFSHLLAMEHTLDVPQR